MYMYMYMHCLCVLYPAKSTTSIYVWICKAHCTLITYVQIYIEVLSSLLLGICSLSNVYIGGQA